MGEKDEYYEEPTSSHGKFVPAGDGISMSLKKGEGNNIQVQHGVVIDLPFIHLLRRKVTKLTECYIVLYEHFMIYKVVAKYDALIHDDKIETDEWVPTKANYRWTRMRADLADVYMSYDNEEKSWVLGIDFKGGVHSMAWNFESPHDCKKIHDVIQNYFVTRDMPKPKQDEGIETVS